MSLDIFPRVTRQQIQKMPLVTRDIVAQRARVAEVPVFYEDACKALVACQTIDESKYWSDKADALAAWAKIFKSKKAEVEAKKLKLHAFRRMGEIAKAMLKDGRERGEVTDSKMGAKKGINHILIKQGLTHSQAHLVSKVSKVPDEVFEDAIKSPKPPSPSSIKSIVIKRKSAVEGSDAYKHLMDGQRFGRLAKFAYFCSTHDAYELARQLSPSEAKICRKALVQCQEWLDAFEQALPKG